jgi:hypothetical protein
MHGKYVPTAASVARDPAWFLEDYDPRRNMLAFVRADRDKIARQPFLDQRWNREGLERCEFPLDALAAQLPEDAPAPKLDFIWHTSFCCSTLIAEALDLPGRHLSLREPSVLVPAADTKRAVTMANRAMPPRLIEVVFRLLGRQAGDERVSVKASNFANVLVRDAARLTQGKALFLYSDLESFLVSMEKGGDGLRKYARRLFSNIAGDAGGQLPWPPREIFQMSDLEIAALAWHMEIAEFRRSARVLGQGRAAWLDCDAFLRDSRAALSAVDGFFGFGLGAAHIERVVAGPLMKRHAKVPSHAFDAERRRTLGNEVRQRLGHDLERLVEWSYRACPDTPRGAPLAGALPPVDKIAA